MQLDQGLGIGSKFPFFNRHQLTLTKFIQLKQVEEGAGKPPPPVLVLHGHYGGCVGDLPSYDAFTLGGPYSVRGYNMGEIGAARNILEVKLLDNIFHLWCMLNFPKIGRVAFLCVHISSSSRVTKLKKSGPLV